MKATDLRPKTKDELKTELGNLRKEAFNNETKLESEAG